MDTAVAVVAAPSASQATRVVKAVVANLVAVANLADINNKQYILLLSLISSFLMKKSVIITALGLLAMANAEAEDYKYLVFENSDGITASIDVSDMEISINGTSLEVINAQGNTLLKQTDLSKMYFSNTADGVIIDADNLILNDDVAFTPSESYSVSTASYSRDMTSQWGTICMPFELTSDETVQYYTLSNVTSTTMTFSPVSTVPAGQPAVLKVTDGTTDATYQLIVSLDNASISPDLTTVTPISGWTMKGTYQPVPDIVEEAGENAAYFIANNSFWYAVSNVSCPAYRGWFETTSSANNASIRIAVGDTEGIEAIEKEDGTVTLSYDLQGRRTKQSQKGLLIQDGKKIIIK